MLLVFVHGWSVTDTDTYGQLPEALAESASALNLNLDIQHIFLGRYISFDDEIRVSDIVSAFDKAIREQIPGNGNRTKRFSCITHSTGGPIVREWIEKYFGARRLEYAPLDHLVMLAPANHGSPLAAIGKKRVGRIKAWFNGIEPGEQILTWLSLGSAEQWRLSERCLAYDPAAKGLYLFVLAGQAIDRKLYDFLNPYLKEVGSDGVVRVSGANMNYSMIELDESEEEDVVELFGEQLRVQLLKSNLGVQRPAKMPLGVLPNASHSGERMGIMRSVSKETSVRRPVVEQILRCLTVSDSTAYSDQTNRLDELTAETQASDNKSKKMRYTTIVFRVREKDGTPIEDYDLYLLGKGNFSPNSLPPGFFVDRQRNDRCPNTMVYYLNFDKLMKVRGKGLGFRVVARPSDESQQPVSDRKNFVYYRAVEFRMMPPIIAELFEPNETVYVDIKIERRIDRQIFRMDQATASRGDFGNIGPMGSEA